MNTTTNKRQVAIENENTVLIEIAKYGWLTASQVAMLCFAKCKTKDSARAMADRTLHRLLEKVWVSRRQSKSGVWTYYLNETGAAIANDLIINDGMWVKEWAHHGYDTSSLNVESKDRLVEACAFISKRATIVMPRFSMRRCGLEKFIDFDAIALKIPESESSAIYTYGVVILYRCTNDVIERLYDLIKRCDTILIHTDARLVPVFKRRIAQNNILRNRVIFTTK